MNGPAQAIDHEAILNVIRLAQAQSQKLAEQWLPITKEELESEESNLKDSLPYRPELAGLGADVSQPSVSDWRGVSVGNTGGAELEKLRRQMLGRKAAATKAGLKRPPKEQTDENVNKKRKTQEQVLSSDDSDEGGRSAAFKSKRPQQSQSALERSIPQKGSDANKFAHSIPLAAVKTKDDISSVKVEDDKLMESSQDSEAPAPILTKKSSSETAKRPSSFLDQILTERSAKKKKKMKRKKGHKGEQDNG